MKSSKSDSFKLWYATSLAFQLGFLIITPIILFILGGIWLDKKLGTTPYFLITGSIFGLIMTVHETKQILLPFLKSK